MTAYRLSSSIGILTALQGIIFLYDSVWVIELGNSIHCYSEAVVCSHRGMRERLGLSYASGVLNQHYLAISPL